MINWSPPAIFQEELSPREQETIPLLLFRRGEFEFPAQASRFWRQFQTSHRSTSSPRPEALQAEPRAWTFWLPGEKWRWRVLPGLKPLSPSQAKKFSQFWSFILNTQDGLESNKF